MRAITRVNMDTQNTSDLVSWLSLAKKHFKPKTIEVMVATTPPLMQDRELLALPTGMCTCLLAKRHVLNRYVGDFRGRLENFFIVFQRKTENKM